MYKFFNCNLQLLMFCWLLPLLVKTDVATLEVNITDHFQDITKKQFQRKQTVPLHKQKTFIVKYVIQELSHSFTILHVLFSGET